MIRFIFGASLMATVVVAAPAIAQSFTAENMTSPQTPEEQSLLAAENAHFRGTLAHDPTAIAAGLADELIYTHANGRVQSKADILASAARPGPAAQIAISNRIVHVFGNGGMTRADRVTKLGAMTLSDSYLGVYVQRGGRWQLIAWQTSPTPKVDAGGAAGQTMAQPTSPQDPVHTRH